MIKRTLIEFEKHERDILSEAVLSLTAVFDQEDWKDDQRNDPIRKVNGVATERAPIPVERLEKVLDILFEAKNQFYVEKNVEYWMSQIEGDPGDPGVPTSPARMAYVLAETRETFFKNSIRAIEVVDSAIKASES